jgi:hypothetical protein
MEAIFAQRFVFCDFSNIVGFPNPMLSRDEWEGFLPTFKGEYWEVSAEHLLDFHEFVHERQIVHKDVHIKLFRYSLKGEALDWCRSLPASSINSLASFHDAFNTFYKEKFPAESLFENCCDVFEKHIQQKADFSSVFQNKNHVSEEDLQDTMDDNVEEERNVFSNLSQDHIADENMQNSSSLSFEF